MLQRRAFMKVLSAAGLGRTLLPGALWAQAQDKPVITRHHRRGRQDCRGCDFRQIQTDDAGEFERPRQGIRRDFSVAYTEFRRASTFVCAGYSGSKVCKAKIADAYVHSAGSGG